VTLLFRIVAVMTHWTGGSRNRRIGHESR